MKDGSGSGDGWRRQPPSGGANGWRDLPSLGGHVDDLAAGFVLGALEPSERRRVDGHRRVCPVCDRLLADEGRVVGLLPLAVPPGEAPPPDVKVALMARVAHAGRAASPPAQAGHGTAQVRPSPTLPASRPSRPAVPTEGPIRVSALLRRRWTAWSSAILALPLLALIGTSIWAVQLRARAEERGERANNFRVILERALDADGAVSELENGPAAPEAEGWVVTEADGHSATLYVRGAESRAGDQLGLIGIIDGTQVALEQVTLDDRGRGIVTFTSARPLTDYRQFRVKVLADGEPAGLALFGRPSQSIATPAPVPGASNVPEQVDAR
ncbi:MAG: hypothetical protein M3Q10_14360 [Chloroflexota bacterium]|nr:hypothetical protein [Chloroflexota bacterium]